MNLHSGKNTMPKTTDDSTKIASEKSHKMSLNKFTYKYANLNRSNNLTN